MKPSRYPLLRLSAAISAAIMVFNGPVQGQTIVTPQPLHDANGDGRIELDARQQKKYGVPSVTLEGRRGGKWIYCGPARCRDGASGAPSMDRFAIAAPVAKTKIPGASNRQWTYAKSGETHSGMHILNSMDTVLYADGIRDFALTDIVVDRSRSFLTPVEYAKTMTNFRLERADLRCGKRCLYIRGDSAQWTIRDVKIRGLTPATSTSDIPVGIAMKDSAHDILVERAELSGFQSNYAPEKKAYPQGDGTSTERGNYNITYRQVFSHDNSDGCFDLKSSNTTLDRVKAARCNYNYRLWVTGTATTIESDSPRNAHVQIAALDTDWTIGKLIAIGPGTLVRFDRPGRLNIKECDLSRWTGTTKMAGKGTIKWGKGC